MAGVTKQLQDWQIPNTPAPSVAPNTFGSPNTYSAAVNTQAADYDSIMGKYNDTINSIKSNPIKYTPITPQLAQYQKTADVTKSLSDLSSLTDTGGYSESDKANIRARGIAPIRSIYAGAQRGLDRNRALSGGYSPNYGAVTAKLAREMSDITADKSTDIEAGIAERVAQNKLSIAPSYANAAGNESGMRNSFTKANADAVNQINQMNARMAVEAQQTRDNMILQAISGMTNLYGTNPALVSVFGNQVATGAGLAANQQSMQNQRQGQIIAGGRVNG